MSYPVEIFGDDGRTDRQLIEEKRLPRIAIFPPWLRSKISASRCRDVGVFGERPLCAKGLNRSRGRALRRAAWPWMDDGSMLPDDEGPEACRQNR
jgi:hypothetical protein